MSSWLLQNERVKAEAVDYDEDIGVDYPFPKAKRMRTEYIVVPPKKVAKPLNRDELGPPPDGIHFSKYISIFCSVRRHKTSDQVVVVRNRIILIREQHWSLWYGNNNFGY